MKRSQAKTNRRRLLTLENLEGRSLLAALVADVLKGTTDTTISGTVYQDNNSNGSLDKGESGIAGWQVYVDLDNSGTRNTDAAGVLEPIATTNKDGDFVINRLIPGTYRLGEIVPSGWTPTSAVSQDVVVVKSKDTKATFFDFRGGEITGTVWNDNSNDGIRDPGELGLSDWTVFLDLNTDGVLDAGEPSTTTDADGKYSFVNVPAKDYEVTEVLPSGWDVSPTFDIKKTASVVSGRVVVQDFANFSMTNGSIQGTVWNDLNGNGIRDTDVDTGVVTEPGLADWTVFLDFNNNGTVDPGEPETITDSTGRYSFVSLPAGDYEVTEVLPAGWNVSPTFDSRQTVAVFGGTVSTAQDFANFTVLNGSISGTVWNDLNRNSLRDVNVLTGAFLDPGLANWTVLLDLNRNHVADAGEPTALTDAQGNYSFFDLQVGDYEVQEFLPTGWEVAVGFSDNHTVTVHSGMESLAPDFANFNVSSSSPASVRGVVWNDLNGNGVRDIGDDGQAGWTVFVDQNADGILSAGETSANTQADGSYSLSGIAPGTARVVAQGRTGWRATAPITNTRVISLRSNETAAGLDFGEAELKDSTIRGTIYADADKDGARDTGERGLSGITVYLDINNNHQFDAGEPETKTSADLFYTPDIDEAGSYSFTHLAKGSYTVREILPATLVATPTAQLEHSVTITSAEDRAGVDTAAVFRANEIRGVRFDDANGNHTRDAGEVGLANTTVFVDLNRNNQLDTNEPSTTTASDGSYTFTGLTPGAYVIREVAAAGFTQTSPTTTGGILWPAGVSNPAVGIVSPLSITDSLAAGASHRETVSLTLPGSGALTNLVDVFLLFDDTGSFVNNSPIVRAAFPDIISQLQSSLSGIDLGFGVGRLEEYANYAYEYSTGRPFVLNQPIVAASTGGYMSAIQAALDRTTPGYGGDQPETDIEALYQLVTGKGFDGNNNGSVLDSGAAGLAATQLNPGDSGDVPSFASFTADPANNVLPAAGNVGGAGFRAGALPIILLATDTGFAYQPKGESVITGVGGQSLPLTSFTETSRSDTPFGSGAGIQETVTALNALGALVIGLGTNPESTLDPRQGLEAISKLTGATNRSTTTINNGTVDPIAPGDPLYFQIASGFGASVASGVVNAIQNAVTNVAVDVTIQASDPRVHIVNHTGIRSGIGAGQTATFDFEIVGDGAPHRFDLQFVRAGTNVVLGSIPVVIGTPISGDGYDFKELEDGEICNDSSFGDQLAGVTVVNSVPSFVKGADVVVTEDAGAQTIANWATSISAGPASEAGQVVNFVVSNDNAELFSLPPSISPDGTLTFAVKPNAYGTATVTVQIHDNGGTANGGSDTSAAQTFRLVVSPVNDAPVAVGESFSTSEDVPLVVVPAGVLSNDTDIDGDTLRAVLVQTPTHGAVTLNSDGSFTYTPAANVNGSDSFTYKANDGTADSNEVTVEITVAAVNDAPIAAGDLLSTSEDTPLLIPPASLLANDTDVDGDPLSVVIVSSPSHGTVKSLADGSLLYQPDPNFFGVDSFGYQATDGVALSNVVNVSVTVTPQNDAPVAVADSYTTAEDAPLVIAAQGVLANDADIEGDVLAAMLVLAPQHGALTLNADGSFTYTPARNFNGADSFSYQANDGSAISNAVIVEISVKPVNDAPVAADDSLPATEDVALSFTSGNLLANDVDVEGDALTVKIVAGPTHGTLVHNADGSFSYTPAANYNGSDSFTYQANDGSLDSNPAVVNIKIAAVNDAPVASNDSYSMLEDATLAVAAAGVLSNDSDVDGDPLTAVLVAGPSHGTLALNADGSFSYKPAANYNGNDSFTYQAQDGSLNSNAVTVSISIAPVNDAPVAGDDSYRVDQGKTLTVAAAGLLVNDRDVDGDPLQASLVTGPSNGSVVVNPNGSFSYTPHTGFSGSDSFTYLATDGLLNSNLATVVITVTPVTTVGQTKFIVVDSLSHSTFNYDALGNSVTSNALNKEDQKPRGIASNKDGSFYWVVDANGRVYVHNQAGKTVGAWEVTGIDKPEGIATNGTDLWIVDQEKDRVYFFAGAAARRTGTISATSSFALAKGNTNPKDVTTDGVHLWVVNDSTIDSVYRYSTKGALEGSWQIDVANAVPTGLTIDPNNVNDLWIVDAATDRVYEYKGAAYRISGTQLANAAFALSSTDSDPQGIADPKALPTAEASLPTVAAVAGPSSSSQNNRKTTTAITSTVLPVFEVPHKATANSTSSPTSDLSAWDDELSKIVDHTPGKPDESWDDLVETLALDHVKK